MQAGARVSQRVRNLHPSPIREILAVIDRPGMISFAGGLPAAETFPDVDLSAMPRNLLQYGPSEGEPVLRRRIADELAAIGLACAPEQVVVLSGSQQGIDLVAKLFIDEGTPVAVEAPTYLAALQAFRFFGARFASIDPAHPAALAAGSEAPAFVYAIPTFANPTGRCLSARERAALAAACDDAGVTLFEDDPYRDLVYDACDRTPVASLVKRASWIYQGSFSKSFAPGLRLGFLAASPDLVPHLARLKQAADLHSNRVSQWLVLEELAATGRANRLAGLAATYRGKRDSFAQGLARHLGGLATWAVPPGGLFFWLTLRTPLDTRGLLPAAIERGVAFMPGEPFFADGRSPAGCLRLNFSHATAAEAETGLAILAELIRDANP